ncbi:MAG: hypothetical protein GF330_02985 [Candidatus Eisenbacteria bacterium]|nr:hypothetical protein [Candidatus Eisenbacteria bacterium]
MAAGPGRILCRHQPDRTAGCRTRWGTAGCRAGRGRQPGGARGPTAHAGAHRCSAGARRADRSLRALHAPRVARCGRLALPRRPDLRAATREGELVGPPGIRLRRVAWGARRRSRAAQRDAARVARRSRPHLGLDGCGGRGRGSGRPAVIDRGPIGQPLRRSCGSRALRRGARIVAGLSLGLLLLAGLWQCARETTRDGPAHLRLDLQRPAAPEREPLTIESIEIEICGPTGRVAADTLTPGADGTFRSALALPAGGPYAARVYGWGRSAGLQAGSIDSGVVAAGARDGLEIAPLRTTNAEVLLADARPRGLTVRGTYGLSELSATWSPVSEATGYTLAWYVLQSAEVGSSAVGADTVATLTWDGAAPMPSAGGGPDSVLFRLRPRFTHRPGVYGDSLWVDLALWLDPPRLDSIAPDAGATVGADTATVALRFDREIDPASIPPGVRWTRQPSGAAVAYDVDPATMPAARFLLRPREMLRMGSDYRVVVAPEVVDLLGRPFDADTVATGLQSHTVEWSTAPYDPLRVAASAPADGDSGVSREVELRVALTRAADPATLTSAALYVTGPEAETIEGQLDISDGADSLFWTPAAPLWFGRLYRLHVTPQLRDPRGQAFDQEPATYPDAEPYEAGFRTLAQPLGPRVEAITPDSGAMAVSRSAQIEVTFSEPIDPSTVRHYDTFRILREGAIGISGDVQADPDGRRVRFVPSSSLQSATDYQVRLRGMLSGDVPGITNPAGVPLDQDREAVGFQPFVSWFRTECPPQVAEVTISPDDGDSLVAVAATFQLAFSRALDPASLGEGERLQLRQAGEAIGADLALVGDSLAVLTPQSALAHLTWYSLWADTLIASPDGSLLDQALEIEGRQPFEQFFKTEPESIHPQVVAAYPAAGDTTVGIADSLALEFDVPIDPASGPAALTLTRLSGDGAPETVPGAVEADSLWLRFFPDPALSYVTDYRIDLSSALISATGFPLDQEPESPGLQPFQRSFRTTRERIPPAVDWHEPLAGATDVPTDLVIRIGFTEPMQSGSVAEAFHLLQEQQGLSGEGTLVAGGTEWRFTPAQPLDYATTYRVRIDTLAVDSVGNHLDHDPTTPGAQGYAFDFQTAADLRGPRVVATEPPRSAANVDVDAPVRLTFSEPIERASVAEGGLRVQDAEGPWPGRVAFAPGDSALAWAPVSLPDSLPIWLAFGTTYEVIADTTVRDLRGNPLDQAPLEPGLQADRFFFTTLPETLGPRVAELLPGETDVPVTATLRLVFSEPMDEAALLAGEVVELSEASGPAVAFAPELNAGGDTLSLVPESWLAFDREYRIGVSTGALDRNGNPLDQDPGLPGDQPYEGLFRTETDLVPPRVATMLPESGAAHVDPATWVRIGFSEALDPATVHEGSVYLLGPDGVVPLAHAPWLEEAQMVAVLEPADSLAMGATFTVVATHLLRDLAGNALDQDPQTGGNQDYTATFTTGRGPVIVWDGPLCAWGDSARVMLDATASYEHDPGDSIAWAVWDWGDGQIDSLDDATRLLGVHDYGLLDLRGCNGIDDDGDGWIDEAEGEGPSPCDESYRIRLRVYDTHGLVDEAVAGVSFCAFLALDSAPRSGGFVTPWDSLRVELSRSVDPASLDSAVIVVQLPDSAGMAVDLSLQEGARVLVVQPQAPLPGGMHLLRLSSGLLDDYGVRLDQDPATAGRQPFDLRFRVPIKPDDPPPAEQGPDSLPPVGE